ncbi:MAG: hypothetical protein IJS92_08680 [Paludibacteraceae bacterium]|nr:hypothetical protein [Paludibacteraceae bacterium]
MKHSFSLLAALCAAVTIYAAERVVWTGNEPISWNTDVYAGTQFETPSGTFDGLSKDQTIKVTVVPGIDEPQYVMTYKAGTGWEWTDLAAEVTANVMSYTVESEQIAQEIAERGLIFRGQGYNITQIAIVEDDIVPIEPGKPYADTEVWSGNVAISWNQEVYAGTELDTYTVKQDMFAGLAEGDSIKVYFTDAIQDAQFNLTYKAGDGWEWTSLEIAQKDGFFTYRVASEQIAKEIADRGLIIRGQGYHAVRIVVGKPETSTAVANHTTASTARKIIENGQVLIIKDGIRYTILGTGMINR